MGNIIKLLTMDIIKNKIENFLSILYSKYTKLRDGESIFENEKRSAEKKEKLERFNLIESKKEEIIKDLNYRFNFVDLLNNKDIVLGYLEERYGNEIVELVLEYRIIEIAANRKSERLSPVIIKKISATDLDNYTPVPVELYETMVLQSFPNQPFDKVIIYCPKPALLTWLGFVPDSDLDVEGYQIKTAFAPSTELILMGWALRDLPMLMLAYTPKIGRPVADMHVKIENIYQKELENFRKIIISYRSGDLDKDYKMMEYSKELENAIKRYEEMQQLREEEAKKRQFNQYEPPEDKIVTSKWIPILCGCAALLFLGLFLWKSLI